MQKANHTAKLISIHQGTSKSALVFLLKNLQEIEKDLDCILNTEEIKNKEDSKKEKTSFLKSFL